MNRQLYLLKRFVKKNLPTILTCLGAVSTAGALYFTGKATVKAVRTYDQLKAEDEGVTKKQILKKVIPYYIPAAGFAASSIACTFSSNHINLKRQRILSNALMASNAVLSTYRNKLVEKIGKEETSKIIEEKVEESRVRDELYSMEKVVRIYDWFSEYEFETTMSRLIDAETDVNRELNSPQWSEGVYPYEKFFKMMHVRPPKMAKMYAWSIEDMEIGHESSWVDFYIEESKNKEGKPIKILKYTIDPTIDSRFY